MGTDLDNLARRANRGGASSQSRGITRAALALGGMSVLCALGIGFLAYQSVLRETGASYRSLYLAEAKMLAAMDLGSEHASDEQLLGEIETLWKSLGRHSSDEYICIVDQNCRLLLHTARPETVGSDVRENLVGGGTGEACSLGSLVRSRGDFVGDYVSSSGEEQIAAFAALRSRDWTIGVHRSKAAVMREMRASTRGLAIGFLVVCGLLMPVSLAMLARTFHGLQRERVKLELQQKRLIEKLELQNAELERFTYTASHDLKAPLVTLKGYLGLLREDLDDEDAAAIEDDVERLMRAADNMAALLDDLLEISRIGRVVLPSAEVPLKALVDEMMELFGNQLAEAKVRVVIASDLPVLYGDRRRLGEVVQNLFDNAIKYMGDQPAPRIEIGSRQENGETVCYVRDNGIGIPREHQARVFGLFEQLDPKAEGTGVGLAVVKRIIELHGSRIWVESEGSGRGSCFCFTVPTTQSVSPME